jgi:hypothetical protein
MTDEANTPIVVSGPGTPQQGNLVPDTLTPNWGPGPVYSKMSAPAGGAVTDVNPVPASPFVRNATA